MHRGLQALRRHLLQSTPKDASAEFIVNSNLLLPHIHIVVLFKAQKPGIILDPYSITVSCSTGACCKLQAAIVRSKISQLEKLDPHHLDPRVILLAFSVPQLWKHSYFWVCSTIWATELLSIKKLVMVSMEAHKKKYTGAFRNLYF